MPLSNSKIPSLKAPNFKVVDLKVPKVTIGVKPLKTALAIKPGRAATIKKVK